MFSAGGFCIAYLSMTSWIAFSIFAALMQSVRTAGQKQLTSSLTPLSVTLVRYLFGLPFVIVYVLFLFGSSATSEIANALVNPRFLFYAVLAGIAQIVATILLVKVFSFRNFAVGTSFAKTEAIQTAIFSLVFFGAALSLTGWLAVLIGFIGIAIVSMPKAKSPWQLSNVVLGTLSGTAFSFTSLWLREASLSLSITAIHSAAMTLFVMVSIQTVICLVYSTIKEPNQIALLRDRTKLGVFVGLTSALGSIGWFTAMTLQNPALVKSIGQIEFIFTLLITTLFFKEKISGREYVGMMFIVASVIILIS